LPFALGSRVASAVRSAIIDFDITDKVNALRPPDNQLPLMPQRWDYWRIRNEYRRLYPNGRLLRVSGGLMAVGVAFDTGCLDGVVYGWQIHSVTCTFASSSPDIPLSSYSAAHKSFRSPIFFDDRDSL
jgi:hypothetical protein